LFGLSGWVERFANPAFSGVGATGGVALNPPDDLIDIAIVEVGWAKARNALC
jgi:hypothetical protein